MVFLLEVGAKGGGAFLGPRGKPLPPYNEYVLNSN